MGTNDQFTSIRKFDRAFSQLKGEKEIVQNVDHFWFGEEKQLVDIILKWLSKVSGQSSSSKEEVKEPKHDSSL